MPPLPDQIQQRPGHPPAMLPSRIMIRDLDNDQLPKSSDIDFDKGWQTDGMSEQELKTVSDRWRYQKR